MREEAVGDAGETRACQEVVWKLKSCEIECEWSFQKGLIYSLAVAASLEESDSTSIKNLL